MTHLFRPTARNWIIACAWSVPLIALFGYLVWSPLKRHDAGAMLLGLLIFSGALISALVKLGRTKIEVSDEEISGRIENETFKLRWASVRAVWQTTQRKQSFLHIAARDQGISIPLKMFNAELLMDLIRLHVQPEALGEDAHKRLPNYRISRLNSQKLIEQTDQPLKVRLWLVRIVGIVCLASFVFLALMSFSAGLGWPTVVLLFIAGIGVYLILASGTIEMTREHVAFLCPINHYQIWWDEVKGIETDANGGNLVFLGKDKRLVCSGPALWYGKDRDRMLKFLLAQAEWREIEIKETQKAMWRRSKNTKVKP